MYECIIKPKKSISTLLSIGCSSLNISSLYIDNIVAFSFQRDEHRYFIKGTWQIFERLNYTHHVYMYVNNLNFISYTRCVIHKLWMFKQVVCFNVIESSRLVLPSKRYRNFKFSRKLSSIATISYLELRSSSISRIT